MDINKQIQVFGDSILKEVMLDRNNEHYYMPKESYSKIIEELLSIQIQNNSRFGCTIDKGFRQLQRALDKGLSCDVVLLGYGGNDCDHNWAEVAANPDGEFFPNTPLDVFEKTYRNMISELKARGIKPLLMSLPPIDAEKFFAWISREGLNKENLIKWIGDIQMIYRWQELYSNTVVKIAKDTNSLFVDVRSKFLSKRNFSELICADGIHPTAEGHKLIKEAFLEFATIYI